MERVTVEIEEKKIYLTLTEAHRRLLALRHGEGIDPLDERLHAREASRGGAGVEDRPVPVLD